MEKGKLFPSEQGTPQGGCIFPLLANIALHGIEGALQKVCPSYRRQENGKRTCYGLQLIRYADDLVALHADLPQLLKAKTVLEEWLEPMGLELKESKTRIGHSLQQYEGKAGFDFLGCTIRQFATGKTYGRRKDGTSMGFTTLISPSKESLKRHPSAQKSDSLLWECAIGSPDWHTKSKYQRMGQLCCL
jgi:RNA-directed DNA polymerase